MPKLIILCGPPGSGKSTYTKDLIENNHSIYINQDSQGKDEHIRLFLMAIEAKKDIIVDRMNFNKEQRNRYLSQAKAAGYETEIKVLYVPRQVCYDRIVKREEHETIKAGDNATAGKVLDFFFKNWERPEDYEADKVTHIYPGGNKPSACICDIDNTLANCDHREHFLQNPGKKNWKGFFDNMDKDPVNEWCRSILNQTESGCQSIKVLLVSARPDTYREITEKWLKEKDVRYNELIMRNRGDYREDSIVKEQILDFELLTRYNIIYWIDDRKRVIDKIRSRGIIVLDCAGEKGNF